MSETPNHGYNVPDEGQGDWHQPLNENFEAFEGDIEVRDEGGPTAGANDYDPAEGAKYLDTRSGIVYVGNGSSWRPSLAIGRYDDQTSLAFGDSTNQATGDGGTVSGGEDNLASGDHSTVGGGGGNAAEGAYATVSGGGPGSFAETGNTASGDGATISGGGGNTASRFCTVSGGYNNEATTGEATIGGGEDNVARFKATVAGGRENRATGDEATVAGGWNNEAASYHASIGGGRQNEAMEMGSRVGGGRSNTIEAPYATIGGGWGNYATADYAVIAGGEWNEGRGAYATVGGGGGENPEDRNLADAENSTVGGGKSNQATGNFATVPGGQDNTASGNHSFAAGHNATADHDGSFVVGDSSTTEITSTDADEAHFQMPLYATDELGLRENPVHVNSAADGWYFNDGVVNNFRIIEGESVSMFYGFDAIGNSLCRGDLEVEGEFTESSDRRIKSEIDHLDGVLEDVCSLKPAQFRRKSDEDDGAGPLSVGFIAQEVREVFPEFVRGDEGEDGILSLSYSHFTALAVQALKEQQDLIDDRTERLEDIETERAEKDDRSETQAERIDDLEAENHRLRERLTALEAHVGMGESSAADGSVAGD